jgi:hypothetical protein
MAEECVSFLDYDKISDDLIWFSKDIVLRFNVRLSYKTQSGERRHYLNEIKYDSRYSNYGKVLTVRRHFDYYLSLDVKYEFESSVLIKAKDMLNVRARLKLASKWFSDGVFGKDKKKKLHVIGSPKPIRITNLSGKYLELQPTIITYDNGDQIEGVRVILNELSYADINVDRFMEWVYLMNSMDMYGCAIGLVNYIRPDLGKNVFNMEKNTTKYEDDFVDESQCNAKIKGHKVVDKKSDSFFDKLDDM